MSFKITYAENPIGSMKTWGKLCCTICMKERIKKSDNLQCRSRQLTNA